MTDNITNTCPRAEAINKLVVLGEDYFAKMNSAIDVGIRNGYSVESQIAIVKDLLEKMV